MVYLCHANVKIMDKKEQALREVRTLIDIMRNWGNVLVPALPGQSETYAHDRFLHFMRYLNEDLGMSDDDIVKECNELIYKETDNKA